MTFTTTRQAFEACEYHDEYVRLYGASGYFQWITANFGHWFNSQFPEHAEHPPELDLPELAALVDCWRDVWLARSIPAPDLNDWAYRVVQVLGNGERYDRWSLPVTEGILTPEFWLHLWASQRAAAGAKC